MKILGCILYLGGFLGTIYILTESRWDFTNSFGSMLLYILFLCLTLGLGTVLMKLGDNSNDEDK